MTLEQLFSVKVNRYSIELNEKYPNMTTEEYLKELNRFANEHSAEILEEDFDWDEFDAVEKEEVIEDLLDDVPVETTDAEATDTEATEFEKEKVSSSKPSKAIKVKKTEYKGGRAIKREDADVDDPRYIVVDGERKILAVNDPSVANDIFNIVDKWYYLCTHNNKFKGGNLQRITPLADIVTTEVTDMSALFAFTNIPNIDISSWDTSSVETMEGMFYRSTFNNDSIEDWDVSSCINFRNMFVGCRFSGDISNWEPGMIDEYEYNEDGSKKTIVETDEDGEHIVYVRKRVRAKLPEVGARLLELETDFDDEKTDLIMGLGKPGKTKPVKKAEEKAVEEKKHVLTIDEFVNEGLYDNIKKGIKSGINYVKKKVLNGLLKINDIVLNIIKVDGDLVCTIEPTLTSVGLIQKFKPKGVKASLGEDVDEESFLDDRGTGEKYGWIKKGSKEYENYLYFMDKFFGKLNTNAVEEARTRLEAGKAFNIPNITTSSLRKKVQKIMEDVPMNTGRATSQAMVIYGVPGVGKTTIPKEIIREYNKHHERKKAFIVVKCGDLEIGGFSLPMPRETDLKSLISKNKALRNKIMAKFDITEDEFNNFANEKSFRTFEAPKTWLPVFDTRTPAGKAYLAAQEEANAGSITMDVKQEDGTWIEEKVDTTEGGIIIFDEFLRADPELFKTICQLIEDRTIGQGEYKLGRGWGIICTSNRPVDDREVEDRYRGLPAAMANRFLAGMYNYIPDFNEWLEWAKNEQFELKSGKKINLFDDDTIAFLIQPTTPYDGSQNEETYTDNKGNEIKVYKNWHTIDVDKFETGEEPIPVTPRGWEAMMVTFMNEINRNDLDNVLDLDFEELREDAAGILGNKIGNAYIDFMKKKQEDYKKSSRPNVSLFFKDESIEVNPDSYELMEAITDIEAYITTHFGKARLERMPIGATSIGEKLLIMAKNMKRIYESRGIITSHITAMHSYIVRRIYKIRRNDKECRELIIRLRPYLEYVFNKSEKGGGGYCVEPLDPDE